MKSMNCLVAGLVVHMRQVSSQAEETLQTLRQNGKRHETVRDTNNISSYMTI